MTKKKIKNKYIKKYVFLVLLFFVFLGIFVGFFVFFEFKQTYSHIKLGKNQLILAVNDFKNSNFERSYKLTNKAQANFDLANSKLDDILEKDYLFLIPSFKSQVSDVKNLVMSAQVLSSAFNKISRLGVAYKIIKSDDKTYTNLSEDEKRAILKLIYENNPELSGIQANLDLAILHLNNLEYRGFLRFFEKDLRDYSEKLKYYKPLFDRTISILKIMPKLLGFPNESNFLVLLENNDELRPTGGFLGTFGILKTHNGNIKNFDTHDIYHIDMPVKDLLKIKPPKPLEEYLGVNYWYMRDSNWSPDWKTAAEKIEWFFYEENQLLPEKNKLENFDDSEFDGVIAISPDFIIDLLDFTGPIMIEGQLYDSENFVDILQYKVERGYIQLGVPRWERKEVIGEISKRLKMMIFDKSIKDLLFVSQIASNNLNEKNILFSFKDEELQSIIDDFNWSGSVRSVENDYVYVVDANMAALKTDSVMKRAIKLQTEQSVSGVFSRLSVNYSHTGDFDWKTTRYRTYTRIYLPLGSNVLEADGFKDDDYEVYEEFGKQVVAGFFSLEPGEMGNVDLYYKLPDYLEEKIKSGEYSLLVQKQPGNKIESLDVEFEFLKNIKRFSPTGFFVDRNKNKIKWETDLQMDREFLIKF